MRTNTSYSILNPSFNPLSGITNPKKEAHKGFILLSNVIHLGVGGNFWLTSIVGINGEIIANFIDEIHGITIEEAKKFIDAII